VVNTGGHADILTVLLIGNYDTSKFEMRGVNYVEKHKVSNRTDLTEISSKPNQIELIRKILSHACLNFFYFIVKIVCERYFF
jgi:hypothetical protein